MAQNSIICPKCGHIDSYKVLRLYQRYEMVDAEGNIYDRQKLEFSGEEAPVCPVCDSKVLVSEYEEAISISNMKLWDLGLSTRAYNGIRRGIEYNFHAKLSKEPTVIEVTQYLTKHNLTNVFRNIGKKTAEEIIKRFEEYGINIPEN